MRKLHSHMQKEPARRALHLDSYHCLCPPGRIHSIKKIRYECVSLLHHQDEIGHAAVRLRTKAIREFATCRQHVVQHVFTVGKLGSRIDVQMFQDTNADLGTSR